ncbi:MAG TPA: hypothetical protein VGR35_05490 [Tepidisphaeraceae bacterium]|nr:hypothetical protein [Tepidisphaeraceae bacterium]
MLPLLIALAIGQENLRVPLTPIADGRHVIVHLVSRDHVVSVTSGPDGPLYSAKTKDGVMVATGVTLQQLRENHPDVYRKLHPAISADASAARD